MQFNLFIYRYFFYLLNIFKTVLIANVVILSTEV